MDLKRKTPFGEKETTKEKKPRPALYGVLANAHVTYVGKLDAPFENEVPFQLTGQRTQGGPVFTFCITCVLDSPIEDASVALRALIEKGTPSMSQPVMYPVASEGYDVMQAIYDKIENPHAFVVTDVSYTVPSETFMGFDNKKYVDALARDALKEVVKALLCEFDMVRRENENNCDDKSWFPMITNELGKRHGWLLEADEDEEADEEKEADFESDEE